MKNRNLDHKDDWATPPYFYEQLNKIYNFNFDPCPFNHNIENWDGLHIDWKERNYINPPYSQKLKEAFVEKALLESLNGNLCVMLLPVSTSTKLFHNIILPNATKIEFVERRLPFIGINSKGQYVNWNQWNKNPPEGSIQVKNSGMHDSMVIVFNKIKKGIPENW